MKDNTVTRGARLSVPIFVISILAVVGGGLAFPSQTFAQTPAPQVLVQTAQLLPSGGGNMCTQPQISGFTPYVYNETLQAFEFRVSDSSYVAIVGSAGNTSIPFNQMTRWVDPSGTMRVHADLATTPIGEGLRVSVTMLSAKGAGQPVCITVISTTLGKEGGPVAPIPAPAPSPAPVGGTGTSKPTPSPAPAAPTPPGTKVGPTTTTGTKATSTPIAAPMQNILKDICSSAVGALRLWTILLIVYALIVLAAIVGQPQMPLALRSQEWVATAIVVPFLLLFGLWYFAESCRTSPWIPVIATIIALAGLAAAFWERKSTPVKTTSVINLPGGKS